MVVKAAHGLDPENVDYIGQLFDVVESAGMRRGIWAWCEGEEPREEAEFHADICHWYRADLFVANCESAYEGSGMWKSAPYVETFRSLQPNIVLGVSVLGGASIPEGEEFTPWARPFDVDPWLAADADFLPQTYWNYSDPKLPPPGSPRHDYRPMNGVECWMNAGVTVNRIHPTIGLWEVPSPVNAAEYGQDLQLAGTVGFSTYLMEQYPVEDAYKFLSRVEGIAA